MRWKSGDGTVVDLSIRRYEFPGAISEGEGDWDANWLVIDGVVQHDGRAWRFSDPCLTTWECQALAARLHGHGWGTALDFTEPNLEFGPVTSDGGRVEFALRLAAEARPPWRRDPESSGPVHVVPLSVPMECWEESARVWSGEVARFPER